MEFQQYTVVKNIHTPTPEAVNFINEWSNSSPNVTARTSGSTGKPKEIKLLKSDMLASAASTNAFFNITEHSTLVCPLSADYIAGKMMIVRALLSGAELWMETPSNTPLNREYGHIDLIAVVPSQVPHLLENTNNRDSLGNILIGGAPLSAEMELEIVEKKFNAFVSYGMTETCSHVALRRVSNCQIDAYEAQSKNCGTQRGACDVPNGDCETLSGACGEDRRGCKLQRGVYEALGDVWFDRDMRNCLIIKSKERSFNELVTNDVVKLIDNKHFIWLGRHDNVINSGGIKVFPEEIESFISDIIPCGLEFYIAKGEDEKWGETPVLVISRPVDDMEKLLSEARAKVNTKAQRPAKIIVTPIEHTLTGKIKRQSFKI